MVKNRTKVFQQNSLQMRELVVFHCIWQNHVSFLLRESPITFPVPCLLYVQSLPYILSLKNNHIYSGNDLIVGVSFLGKQRFSSFHFLDLSNRCLLQSILSSNSFEETCKSLAVPNYVPPSSFKNSSAPPCVSECNTL